MFFCTRFLNSCIESGCKLAAPFFLFFLSSPFFSTSTFSLLTARYNTYFRRRQQKESNYYRNKERRGQHTIAQRTSESVSRANLSPSYPETSNHRETGAEQQRTTSRCQRTCLGQIRRMVCLLRAPQGAANKRRLAAGCVAVALRGCRCKCNVHRRLWRSVVGAIRGSGPLAIENLH